MPIKPSSIHMMLNLNLRQTTYKQYSFELSYEHIHISVNPEKSDQLMLLSS